MKAIILNVSPFGPKDDDGIGKNTVIQYINLENCKDTEKSKGYYVSFNVLYESTQKSLFKKIKKSDLLRPCEITISGRNSLKDIEFK